MKRFVVVVGNGYTNTIYLSVALGEEQAIDSVLEFANQERELDCEARRVAKYLGIPKPTRERMRQSLVSCQFDQADPHASRPAVRYLGFEITIDRQ